MLVLLIWGIFSYAFEMGSGAVIHITSFNEDWSRHSKVNRGDTQTHTDSNVISQAYFYFFKLRKVGMKSHFSLTLLKLFDTDSFSSIPRRSIVVFLLAATPRAPLGQTALIHTVVTKPRLRRDLPPRLLYALIPRCLGTSVGAGVAQSLYRLS
jgi:hypothetical protein